MPGRASPALYPAADPHVIAVTATDIDDKLFTGANRGNHVAIAAPGVDILVPAPAGEYQVTTGTSVATAHISGVVALMLERNPQAHARRRPQDPRPPARSGSDRRTSSAPAWSIRCGRSRWRRRARRQRRHAATVRQRRRPTQPRRCGA